MFKKYGFRIITVLVVLLFSAVFAYTHSGRTDRYGGHHDRKNGGYHYHNTGTVPRSTTTPRSTTPAPTRSTPSIDVLLSEGNMPYTPTRIEWLALDLNAGVPTSSVRYYTTTKANTIQVCVFYNSTITLKERQDLMKFGKAAIKNEADVRGWTWLKLEEKYQKL